MLEIVIKVCLLAMPNACLDNIRLTASGNNKIPFQCVMSASEVMVSWIEENNRWFIKQWRCEDNNSKDVADVR
jgi:hypothetical protein